MNIIIETLIVVVSAAGLVFLFTEHWPRKFFIKHAVYVLKRTAACTVITWIISMVVTGDTILSATITGILGVIAAVGFSQLVETIHEQDLLQM